MEVKLIVRYFERVEALLRRSIGVSLSAKTDTHVRPAPPTAHGPLSEEGVAGDDDSDDRLAGLHDEVPEEEDAAQWADWASIKKQMEKEKGDNVHDEL
jgi:heat shock protein beta